MKIYSKTFENKFMKHINDKEDIQAVKIKKDKDCYNIIISINNLNISLYEIKDCIETINEKYYEGKIKIGKMLIEI